LTECIVIKFGRNMEIRIISQEIRIISQEIRIISQVRVIFN
jgi:hypothetical protein